MISGLDQLVVLLVERGAALPSEQIGEQTPLDDLALDSLEVYELLLDLAAEGVDLPEDLFPTLRTVGDLHHLCVLRAPQAAGR